MNNPSPLLRSALSPARRQLVDLIVSIHFGRIEKLLVRDGQPLFEPAPRVVRTLKMNGRNDPRARSALVDFMLRKEDTELLEQIRRLGTGCVPRIEIANGLPLFAEFEEPTRDGVPA